MKTENITKINETLYTFRQEKQQTYDVFLNQYLKWNDITKINEDGTFKRKNKKWQNNKTRKYDKK